MNPVTIITGGSRGIGAATARRLANHGHHVAIGYRRDHHAADTVVADIRATGRHAVAVPADTTDPDAITRLFDAAADLGPLTGLVNNAGVTSPIGPFTELRADDLRHVVDVNLIGYVLCAQQAARRLTHGGAIVNVSSAAATLGSPGSTSTTPPSKPPPTPSPSAWPKNSPPTASASTAPPPASSAPTCTPSPAHPTAPTPPPTASHSAAPANPTRSPPPSPGSSAPTPATPPAPSYASPAASDVGTPRYPARGRAHLTNRSVSSQAIPHARQRHVGRLGR